MSRQTIPILALALALVAIPPTLAASNAEPVPALVSNRYVVAFHDLAAEDLSHGAWNGHTLVRVNEALGTVLVEVDNPATFELATRTSENVAYTEWDDPLAFSVSLTPNDPRYDDQYGFPQIEAPTAWNTELGSTSVKVAVLDTGIQANHEDLAGVVVAQKDFVNDDNTANDDCGHGTHVAGTVAARTDNGIGVAGTAQVSLVVGKVLSPLGLALITCSGSNADIADAITWATDEGSRVISMSLGGPSGSSVLRDAVQYAEGQGVLVVAAAGNDGPCSNCVSYPAAFPEVVAVTCTTSSESQCSFSSDGPESELAAPGSGIWSTYTGNGYRSLSGTSMSTPHVAGVAGLVFSKAPTMTGPQVRQLLRDTAEDLGASGFDQLYGYGEVDAAAAIAATGGGGGGNNAPTAAFSSSCSALTCDLDASASSDPDGDALTYAWDLGDGNTASGQTPTHTYATDGTYTVTLTVTDTSGADDVATDTITVSSGGGGGSGLSTDFESGAAGWTTTDNGGPAAWSLTTARASSGSTSYAIRNYGANEDDILLSPAVDLAGLTSPELTVSSWMEGERACFLFTCTIYDHGRIQVSADGGQSWRTLVSNYYASSGWETLTFSLAQEEGEVVQVRFQFFSDGSVHNEGWYIDDVSIG